MNEKQAKRLRAALAPRDKLSSIATPETGRVSRGDFFRITTDYEAVPNTTREREYDVVVDLKVVPPFGSKIKTTSNTIRCTPASPRGVYRAVKRKMA